MTNAEIGVEAVFSKEMKKRERENPALQENLENHSVPLSKIVSTSPQVSSLLLDFSHYSLIVPFGPPAERHHPEE